MAGVGQHRAALRRLHALQQDVFVDVVGEAGAQDGQADEHAHGAGELSCALGGLEETLDESHGYPEACQLLEARILDARGSSRRRSADHGPGTLTGGAPTLVSESRRPRIR